MTDAVLELMTECQNRPLDRVYPVVFIDEIVVKVRDGQVVNPPFYVATGVATSGERDILGIWAGDGGEGATYRLAALTCCGGSARVACFLIEIEVAGHEIVLRGSAASRAWAHALGLPNTLESLIIASLNYFASRARLQSIPPDAAPLTEFLRNPVALGSATGRR